MRSASLISTVEVSKRSQTAPVTKAGGAKGNARPCGRGARWGAWALAAAVLLPAAAWGEQTASEKLLKEQLDHRLWKTVGGCPGAERYLKALPEGLHADEARGCLAAGQAAGQVEGLLVECEAHLAAGRLSTGRGGNAVDCYEKVLSLDSGNREALSGLDRVMEEYGRRVRKALEEGRLERARGFLEKMSEVNAESLEVMDLEDAIAEAEREAHEAERQAEERERKAKEAEERRAEAERKAEAEERRKRARRPGDTFRDCPGCPEMVVVPAGRFRMGSTSGYDDERPVHEVTIARPFAVGVYEVTFAEWDACVSDRGCGGYRPGDDGWGRGKRPVMNVSWNDAQAYVRWLSEKTGKAYRLLSEAEWEYVARAGTTTNYWWGNDIGRSRANCRGCGSRWDGRQTAPVGSFPTNPFGLHDVHGNVWEWVEDCWNGSYDGAPRDGSAWKSGDCDDRRLRGGSWNDLPRDLRSAYRDGLTSGGRVVIFGFRVARSLTP